MTKSTCQFIETLLIENARIANLQGHQKRVNSTFQKYFPDYVAFSIEKIVLSSAIYTNLVKIDKRYKCRIVYSWDMYKVEIEEYNQTNINSLKIVQSESFDYSFKYANRDTINALREKKGKYDDIIISINGIVTDCSFANLVFFDGKKYYTPLHPLLAGTKRLKLLEENIISSIEIKEKDINKFREVHLINALANLGDYIIKTERIY
jgi:4-amino-4-deoxychorismate lyase